ncbi:MAG: right-handed parallel beta-helix repeat-containing protein [Geobacteraceae bacterium]|nr:right-handed parallel beta-helix repeat-containing protein [Geobacteraceae bacterium]
MRCSFRYVLFISLCLPGLCLAALTPVVPAQQGLRPVANQVTSVYENATITEDVSLRGVVSIKGSLTVAPQATLRIEPGAEIRFTTNKGSRLLPRLVVMGRLHAAGTLDHPIIFTSGSAPPLKKGAWGGILLLSSEKRNQLEHCRIEYAETALEGRFSNFSLKSVAISASVTGLMLHDTTAGVTQSSISGCETGIEAHDSEVDLRDTAIAQNRRGTALYRCAVVMSSVTVAGNSQQGIMAEEGRIKLTSCEVSGNGVGLYIKGGEGQLFMSRFVRNNDTALHLDTSRLKINRCQISENLRDGLKLEDGRATIWGNAFGGNGGYNLVNTGTEIITAVQNWWGAADEKSVKSKIFDANLNGRVGVVQIFPWLLQKPVLIFP